MSRCCRDEKESMEACLFTVPLLSAIRYAVWNLSGPRFLDSYLNRIPIDALTSSFPFSSWSPFTLHMWNIGGAAFIAAKECDNQTPCHHIPTPCSLSPPPVLPSAPSPPPVGTHREWAGCETYRLTIILYFGICRVVTPSRIFHRGQQSHRVTSLSLPIPWTVGRKPTIGKRQRSTMVRIPFSWRNTWATLEKDRLLKTSTRQTLTGQTLRLIQETKFILWRNSELGDQIPLVLTSSE